MNTSSDPDGTAVHSPPSQKRKLPHNPISLEPPVTAYPLVMLDRLLAPPRYGYFEEWGRSIGVSLSYDRKNGWITLSRGEDSALPSREEFEFIFSRIAHFYESEEGFAQLVAQAAQSAASAPDLPAPPLPSNPQPGYVYVMEAGGRYKIGASSKPEQRLATVRGVCPVPVTLVHTIKADNMFAAEAQLHSIFAENRLHGEWFELDEKDLWLICGIKSIQGDDWEEER